MSISQISSLYGKFRLSGLATGLDTDQMVKDLMKVERIPLDRLEQKKQLTEWKMNDYRNIINLLRGLKDEYFNLLKPASNMLSQSTYKKFKATSSDSSVVTVEGSATATPGTHTVTVLSLATADKAVSTQSVTDDLTGIVSNFSLSGKTIKVTLDGVTREIQLGNYTNLDDLISNSATGLQVLLDNAFGANKIIVSNASGALKFQTTGGASRITLYDGTTNSALADLGFTSGQSNRINTGETLQNLALKFRTDLQFNADGKLIFKINDKEFVFDKSDTLSYMMNTINSDESAGVNISYDEVSDKFVIVAKQLGAGDNIRIQQTGGNFFDGASYISVSNPVSIEGTDASAMIDGQLVTRSSNTFTINGITYNLLKTAANPVTIEITQDVDAVFNNIKSFVEKYNEVIDTINKKLLEKYDREYQPLTQEQKDSMKEDEIKKWEEKAKTGLLRNDSTLQNIVYSMRKALSDSVYNVDITLSEIGITTGSYEERGKLVIDEAKLKDAIKNNPDGVMNLFSKKSSITSNIDLTYEQKTIRYNEEGLAYRIFDIIEDNIRTIRDKNNKKGILLEIAGMDGDVSEFTNSLYKEINSINKEIDKLNDKLYEKENNYYKKFAALEKAIAQMNAQSSWLSSQFSQGG